MKTTLLSINLILFSICCSGQCFTNINAGYNHSAGIKSNGTFWVTGAGNWGQQGNTSDFDEYSFHQLTNSSTWQSLQCSQFNTFGIKADGTLWGCGGNLFGGMGIGSTTDHISVMTQIGTSSDWKQISPSSYSTIALKTNGTIWGWGFNDGYQLGDGTLTNRLSPVQIGTDSDWKAVESSDAGSGFAIKNNGTLWCWGTNFGYLLGNSSVTTRVSPIQHNTDTDWDKMSVGPAHILITKTNGTLWTWGADQYGQTAQNPSPAVDYSAPFQIAGNWKTASAGFQFSMGIKTDGTLWAWGLNDVGQLGNGSTGEINYIPVQIGTANNWTAISSGYQHSIGLRADGSVWSWGSNDFGQLGNDGTTAAPLPTYIPTAGCSLSVDEFSGNTIQLSPNPVNTLFSLSYKGVEPIDTITIYDLAGKEVYRIDALGNTMFGTTFNVASLLPGIYIVTLNNKDKKVGSVKMIKE